MFDHRICASTALSGLLWVSGLALILLDLCTGHQTGELGLFGAGIGGVLNIRGFFREQADRERNAFELGQDWAASESGVRSIHR